MDWEELDRSLFRPFDVKKDRLAAVLDVKVTHIRRQEKMNHVFDNFTSKLKDGSEHLCVVKRNKRSTKVDKRFLFFVFCFSSFSCYSGFCIFIEPNVRYSVKSLLNIFRFQSSPIVHIFPKGDQNLYMWRPGYLFQFTNSSIDHA